MDIAKDINKILADKGKKTSDCTLDEIFYICLHYIAKNIRCKSISELTLVLKEQYPILFVIAYTDNIDYWQFYKNVQEDIDAAH